MFRLERFWHGHDVMQCEVPSILCRYRRQHLPLYQEEPAETYSFRAALWNVLRVLLGQSGRVHTAPPCEEASSFRH